MVNDPRGGRKRALGSGEVPVLAGVGGGRGCKKWRHAAVPGGHGGTRGGRELPLRSRCWCERSY